MLTMGRCPTCHADLLEPDTWCNNCGSHPAPDVGGELASFGQRVAAASIDGAALVTWLCVVLLVEGMGQSDFFDPPYSVEENGLIGATLAYVLVVLWLTFTGRSIGKAVLGLSVVDGKGEAASVPAILLRETVGKLLSLAPAAAGYAAAFNDDRSLTLHDRIAGTFVVHRGAAYRQRLRRRSGSSGRRRRRYADRHA